MNIVKSNRKIHTASDFAKNCLLYLQESGSSRTLVPHESSHSHLDSYLFFIVTDGSGTLSYQDSIYTMGTHSCAFIDCSKPYSHQSSSVELWTLEWVHFNSSNMSEIYNKYIDRGGNPVFMPSDIKIFSDILKDIHELNCSDDYIKDMKINEKIAGLLTLIMGESRHPENVSNNNDKRNSLQHIRKYIDDNYKENITLDMLSGEFYINKFYLTRAFKRQFGITINAYLTTTRIAHAKELLRFSSMTLEQIGAEVGINDPGYFNNVFKRVEGITPGAYRKQW